MDIGDSVKLIEHLGIKRYDINIGSAFQALMAEVEDKLGHPASAQTRINMAPRLRMTSLYAISQSNNGRVANTAPSRKRWKCSLRPKERSRCATAPCRTPALPVR